MEYKNKFHILDTLPTKTKIGQKKQCFLLLLLLVSLNSVAFGQTHNSSIAWNTSFAAAQTLAKSINRPLFLFFEDTPANAITLSLLQNTFISPDVSSIINEHFVPLRIKNNSQLASTFNVIRYPTIIITDSTGQRIINRISGIMSTKNVLDLLNTNINTAKKSIASTEVETGIKNSLPTQSQQSELADHSQFSGTQSQLQYSQAQSQFSQAQSQFSQAEKTTSIPSQGLGYRYNGGSFIQIDNEHWVHKTPFYTVNYKIYSDSKYFYYLESENKETFVAVPKSKNNSLWIWESNVWRRISRGD